MTKMTMQLLEPRNGREGRSKLRRFPSIETDADRLARDLRLGLMQVGRSASNFQRAPIFRSSRVG